MLNLNFVAVNKQIAEKLEVDPSTNKIVGCGTKGTTDWNTRYGLSHKPLSEHDNTIGFTVCHKVSKKYIFN